jgi:hypothetical protein
MGVREDHRRSSFGELKKYQFSPREEVMHLFSVGGDDEGVVGIECLFERGQVAPQESSKFCIMRKENKNE